MITCMENETWRTMSSMPFFNTPVRIAKCSIGALPELAGQYCQLLDRVIGTWF